MTELGKRATKLLKFIEQHRTVEIAPRDYRIVNELRSAGCLIRKTKTYYTLADGSGAKILHGTRKE